jgi:transcriptional regulator
MYTPEHFKMTDPEALHRHIDAHPFATLVSSRDTIEATHIPIHRFSDGHYYGHFARRNPQSALPRDAKVCAIFPGPHAYISPTFYASEFNVPTWNYSAVHCHGTLTFIDDPKLVWELFIESIERFEGPQGWKLPEEERYRALLAHLRFFRFKIERMEGVFKWNQNKSAEDVESVIARLEALGEDDAAKTMQAFNTFVAGYQ